MNEKKLETLALLKEKLNEIEQNPFTEAIIKDNKVPFSYDKKLYRCVMPSQSDLMKAKDYEDETNVRLVRQKDTISRKELIKVLKKNQNIDIIKFEKDKEEIVKKINEVYLSLYRVQDLNKERINKLIEEIKKLLNEFQDVGWEISKHLSSCIDNKKEVAFIRFLTAKCTEVQNDNGDWNNVWLTFEVFEADNSSLPLNAEYWFSRLYVQTRS